MKPDVAKKFLACLGIQKVEIASGWLNCSCPLARWTHKKGHDHQPSFGLRLSDGMFNCFSCGAAGGLSTLLSNVLMLAPDPSKYDLKTAYAILGGLDLEAEPLPEFTEFDDQQVFSAWPEWWLEQWPKAAMVSEARQYLLGRGVPESMWESREYRWDEWRRMIVCPYRSAFGALAGARGRCIDPDAPKGRQHFDYKHEQQNNARLTWYNEQALQLEGPIIVVEGQFDVAHLLQVTPNVVGNLTAKITAPKLSKLTAKDSVIFMLDNDETGQMAMYGNKVYAGAVKMLDGRGPKVGVFDYPAEYKDPDKVPLEWLRKEFEGVVPLNPC